MSIIPRLCILVRLDSSECSLSVYNVTQVFFSYLQMRGF